MKYSRIIILLVVVLLVIVAASALFTDHSVSKQDSTIKILNNNTIYTNDSVIVKLTDLSNNPIAGENVDIAIYDKNGTLVTRQSVKTGSDGVASLNLTNVSEGEYSVNITFEGNSEFNASSLTRNLNVIDLYVDEAVEEEVAYDEGYEDYDYYYYDYYGGSTSTSDAQQSSDAPAEETG
ncbi:Ig-like domain-containing protein [Methanobrevibacter sp.]|uniref:Ig-like domain-containing protein n=1 Tax=Methanobrevibacter sp. TaxID=66852 RepID=UPI00388FEB5F